MFVKRSGGNYLQLLNEVLNNEQASVESFKTGAKQSSGKVVSQMVSGVKICAKSNMWIYLLWLTIVNTNYDRGNHL